MPKRLFQVLSSTQNASLGVSWKAVTASNVDVSYPHPLEVGEEVGNRQRLVKRANPQDNVCVSGWSGEAGDHPSPETAFASAAPSELRQLKQHIQQQQRLREVERQLRSQLEPRIVLDTAVVEVAALFGAQHVSVLKRCDHTKTFQQTAHCGNVDTSGPALPLTLSPVKYPQFCQMLSEGQFVRIAVDQCSVGPSVDSEFDDELRQWLACWPGNWLLLPIQQVSSAQPKVLGHESAVAEAVTVDESTGKPIAENASGNWGLMAVSLPVRGAWAQSAIAAAKSIAAELALALTHAQQYQALLSANQALQKLALSDGLTSLANRRRFDEHLADEWQRLARDKRPLSLILCDLDHFKLYNDTFGHPAGDRCLIRVARALLSGPQRPADLVSRYGGEEFAIILPNTDTHGAWRIAQKIHDSIRALQIPHADESENDFVTVTMGVSTVIPGHDNTPHMLVQASDLALYHAKQHGRNRTYVNGHYNTVANRSPVETAAASDQPDVMPADVMPVESPTEDDSVS